MELISRFRFLNHLFFKARLSETIKLTKKWNYYFAGITIGQWGFGIIWRDKKDEGPK